MISEPNVRAFLQMIVFAEGTAQDPFGRLLNPYRTCYGYKHTIVDFRDHPAVTGEWTGEPLTQEMCVSAGFPSGRCRTTAAGAYQIVRPTWLRVKKRLQLPNFEPENQQKAAVELIRGCGAFHDVLEGRIDVAVRKCNVEWASLPGNFAGQPQRRRDDLVTAYLSAGGSLA